MSVYFITARELGTVKIGIARNPKSRLANLQTAAPAKLKLEAIMKGGRSEELALHTRFSQHLLHGEWFRITPELDALIKSSGLLTTIIAPVAPPPPVTRTWRMTDEELAHESIKRERETYAECMDWRARFDRGLIQELRT